MQKRSKQKELQQRADANVVVYNPNPKSKSQPRPVSYILRNGFFFATLDLFMHASDSYSLQLPIDRTILLRRPCFFVVKTSQIQVLEVLKVLKSLH